MNARHIQKKIKIKFFWLKQQEAGGQMLACYALCSHPGVAPQAAAHAVLRETQDFVTLAQSISKTAHCIGAADKEVYR